ncbi:rhodanese-like domain-containing protein [Pontiellaceae bacterium B12227]|nr:rhodanese-like domain-containing protein [Pontiellaceae bacterium B12227]
MMKTLGKIGLAVVVGFLFVNLLFGGKGDKGADIPKLLKEGALLIDTRTPGEFSNGHVQGAINIPYDIIARAIDQYETNKTQSIIVYCRSGSRSSYAKRYLIDAGYTNVVDAGSIGNMQKQARK